MPTLVFDDIGVLDTGYITEFDSEVGPLTLLYNKNDEW